MASAPISMSRQLARGSFWGQGRLADAHAKHRGGNGASGGLGPALGHTGRSHCLVEPPQQLLFGCIALCSCFTDGGRCGSVSSMVRPVSALRVRSGGHGAGPAAAFPWPSLREPARSVLQWPLQPAFPAHLPTSLSLLRPGELFPAHLVTGSQRWPGQPGNFSPSGRLQPAAQPLGWGVPSEFVCHWPFSLSSKVSFSILFTSSRYAPITASGSFPCLIYCVSLLIGPRPVQVQFSL